MTFKKATSGLLSLGMIHLGQAKSFSFRLFRFSKENFPKILELVDGLKAIGEKRGATAGQVALAWLLAQGEDIIPIPGTKKIKVSSSACNQCAMVGPASGC